LLARRADEGIAIAISRRRNTASSEGGRRNGANVAGGGISARDTVGLVDGREDGFAPNADELVANNARFADTYADQSLELYPRRRLIIVACMDSRMDIFEMLGLAHGDAHIIRNAGGVVTDDVIRSIVLSQRLLRTREIILIHHTDCGLQKIVGDSLKDELETETGVRPEWAIESFKDPFQDVRQSIRRLRLNPFVVDKGLIRGFVFRVEDGKLEETTA
jgi:carbonic anhydrase